MKKIKKVRWDPIIAKLADNTLKKEVCKGDSNNIMTSMINEKWVAAVEKRRSKEEFQAYLHELFDNKSPKIKYQNPDNWNVYPVKQKK